MPDSTGVVGSGAVRLTEIKTIAPGQTIEMEIKTLAQGTGDVAFARSLNAKTCRSPCSTRDQSTLCPLNFCNPRSDLVKQALCSNSIAAKQPLKVVESPIHRFMGSLLRQDPMEMDSKVPILSL